MSEITGRAKKYDGSPIDYVSIFYWSDGRCIKQIVPDAEGDWAWAYDRSAAIGITYVSDGCEPITHGPYFIVGGWSPSILFDGRKSGVWYDPSDITTLFQDVYGTIPVTESGQRVGLIRDKSGNDNHATQSVAGRRPTYMTNGVLSWLAFVGGERMSTSSFETSYSTGFHVCAGVQRLGSGAIISREGGGEIVWAGNSSAVGNGWTTGFYNYFTTDSSYVDGTTSVVSSTFKDSTVKSSINKPAIDILSTVATAPSPNNPLFLGSYKGTSLFGNFHLYSLILSEDLAITETVNYTAEKSGVIL